MKRLILAVVIGLAVCSPLFGDELKISTMTSALTDRVGNTDRPGLLFKFELPAKLEKARIDLAYLRFKVESDTAQEALGLLVRPMLQAWSSGARLSTLPASAVSRSDANFGGLSRKSGRGKVEITEVVRAWQSGGLSNFGLLVYPAEEMSGSFKLRNLPDGGVAQLEIFYTAPEVAKTTDSTAAK